MRSLEELSTAGKTVLVRVDFNSPIEPATERILDDGRIRGHVGTISSLDDAAVVLISHQSRPGRADFTTLETHAERLSRILGRKVRYIDSVFGSQVSSAVNSSSPGDVFLLENARFYSEEYIEMEPEEAEQTHLVQELAPLFDAYVNDAFSAAHRSQPSIVGFPRKLPAYAGSLMEREVQNLGGMEEAPRPRVFALGGAKAEDALNVAWNVAENGNAEKILFSGVIGNLMLAAEGHEVGEGNENFLQDKGYLGLSEDARELLEEYGEIVETPTDVGARIGDERVEVGVGELPVKEPALDIGIETAVSYSETLRNAGTAVVNGPAGVYEENLFQRGTYEILSAATEADFSIAGGGDTSAATESLGVTGFDHVSSGGGASTAMLAGENLPGIMALEE